MLSALTKGHCLNGTISQVWKSLISTLTHISSSGGRNRRKGKATSSEEWAGSHLKIKFLGSERVRPRRKEWPLKTQGRGISPPPLAKRQFVSNWWRREDPRTPEPIHRSANVDYMESDSRRSQKGFGVWTARKEETEDSPVQVGANTCYLRILPRQSCECICKWWWGIWRVGLV